MPRQRLRLAESGSSRSSGTSAANMGGADADGAVCM